MTTFIYFDYKFNDLKGAVSNYQRALFRKVKQRQEILQLKTLLLGLGPRYFFNHYPGH